MWKSEKKEPNRLHHISKLTTDVLDEIKLNYMKFRTQKIKNIKNKNENI